MGLDKSESYYTYKGIELLTQTIGSISECEHFTCTAIIIYFAHHQHRRNTYTERQYGTGL